MYLMLEPTFVRIWSDFTKETYRLMAVAILQSYRALTRSQQACILVACKFWSRLWLHRKKSNQPWLRFPTKKATTKLSLVSKSTFPTYFLPQPFHVSALAAEVSSILLDMIPTNSLLHCGLCSVQPVPLVGTDARAAKLTLTMALTRSCIDSGCLFSFSYIYIRSSPLLLSRITFAIPSPTPSLCNSKS